MGWLQRRPACVHTPHTGSPWAAPDCRSHRPSWGRDKEGGEGEGEGGNDGAGGQRRRRRRRRKRTQPALPSRELWAGGAEATGGGLSREPSPLSLLHLPPPTHLLTVQQRTPLPPNVRTWGPISFRVTVGGVGGGVGSGVGGVGGVGGLLLSPPFPCLTPKCTLMVARFMGWPSALACPLLFNPPSQPLPSPGGPLHGVAVGSLLVTQITRKPEGAEDEQFMGTALPQGGVGRQERDENGARRKG